MLDFKGISVHYGHQDVLTDVTFRVNKGDRVGVVGPNGSGKSTLFKIVLGEMSTDKGELVIENSPRIGWTRQNPEPDTPEETLLEYSRSVSSGVSGSGFCRVHPMRGEFSITSSPLSVDISPRTILKSVDFPLPFGPTTPTRSPLLTRNVTSVRTS